MSPLFVVEVASLFILSAFLLVLGRARPFKETFREVAVIGAAAWIAEVTCIRLYGFYQYDAPWTLFVDRMPLLVALIWPFVIISARELARALRLRDSRAAPHPLAVFGIVLYDASLVEPLAVRSELWSWNEPGLFGVPLIGILGWAFFAATTSVLLDRLKNRLFLLVLAPLVTHALLLATWWGALRWMLRDEISPPAAAIVSAAIAIVLTVLVKKLGRKADLAVMGPRMGAAALFFLLLFWRGREIGALIVYCAAFALPYFAATEMTISSARHRSHR